MNEELKSNDVPKPSRREAMLGGGILVGAVAAGALGGHLATRPEEIASEAYQSWLEKGIDRTSAAYRFTTEYAKMFTEIDNKTGVDELSPGFRDKAAHLVDTYLAAFAAELRIAPDHRTAALDAAALGEALFMMSLVDKPDWRKAALLYEVWNPVASAAVVESGAVPEPPAQEQKIPEQKT